MAKGKGNIKAQRRRHYQRYRARLLAKQKAKYAANPEKFRQRVADWRARNPDYWKGRCRKKELMQMRSKKYGITPEQLEAMRQAQGNRCAICNNEFAKGKRRECVDHCHATGRVRGLLCQTCNMGLGHFQDNPQLLASAQVYLGAHQQAAIANPSFATAA